MVMSVQFCARIHYRVGVQGVRRVLLVRGRSIHRRHFGLLNRGRVHHVVPAQCNRGRSGGVAVFGVEMWGGVSVREDDSSRKRKESKQHVSHIYRV